MKYHLRAHDNVAHRAVCGRDAFAKVDLRVNLKILKGADFAAAPEQSRCKICNAIYNAARTAASRGEQKNEH
jgi:hypothetical protein